MPTMIVANDVPWRLAERFSRGSSNVLPRAVAVLLREGPSTISGVPDNVLNSTKPNMTGRYSTRAKNVIGWSIRLIVRRSLRSAKSPTRLAGSKGASGRRGIGTGEPIPQGA